MDAEVFFCYKSSVSFSSEQIIFTHSSAFFIAKCGEFHESCVQWVMSARMWHWKAQRRCSQSSILSPYPFQNIARHMNSSAVPSVYFNVVPLNHVLSQSPITWTMNVLRWDDDSFSNNGRVYMLFKSPPPSTLALRDCNSFSIVLSVSVTYHLCHSIQTNRVPELIGF